MAEGEAEDRTQAASERRLQRAREDGQVPMSREIPVAAGLAAASLVLILAGPGLVQSLTQSLRAMLVAEAAPGLALQRAASAWLGAAGPLLFAVCLAGASGVMLQTGFLLHGGAAVPDLARLDPRRGLKRVFGLGNAVEALKALAKLGLLGWAVWRALLAVWPQMPGAPLWTTATLLDRIGREVTHLLLLVLGLQCGIAALDMIWMRWRFSQRMRMSREEQRQEQRESDGDPRVKARLKQLRRARSQRRMMAAVAKATVVVTNPTHYAVALLYDRGSQSAPRIVAKGVDEVAARIRDAAAKAGVPLVANPPLARALHELPLDAEVPAEHFRVVAELIAYVWRLRTKAPDL